MRKILHVDLNNFYASVECIVNPLFKNQPLVVCGNVTDRKGVVLAKNKVAKALGIQTGMVVWEAMQLAPNLIVLNANFKLYMKYSKQVRNILLKYSNFVEPFGIDESWVDVSKSEKLFGDYLEIANKIKTEIKEKTKLTVSIGASFNKIFAKIASDEAGSDEILEITSNNFKKILWVLPIEKLLYVGKATKNKLNKINIFTIGDLARTDESILQNKLGKWGIYLHDFANGNDNSTVSNYSDPVPFKSVGNSLTYYRDLLTFNDVKMMIVMLCDAVASRCRELGVFSVSTLHLFVKDSALNVYNWSRKFNFATVLSNDFIVLASDLFKNNYNWFNSVRAMGISVSGLCFNAIQQKNLFNLNYDKEKKLEFAIDKVRNRFGNSTIKKAVLLKDKKNEDINILEDHTIHPENFFKKRINK